MAKIRVSAIVKIDNSDSRVTNKINVKSQLYYYLDDDVKEPIDNILTMDSVFSDIERGLLAYQDAFNTSDVRGLQGAQDVPEYNELINYIANVLNFIGKLSKATKLRGPINKDQLYSQIGTQIDDMKRIEEPPIELVRQSITNPEISQDFLEKYSMPALEIVSEAELAIGYFNNALEELQAAMVLDVNVDIEPIEEGAPA